MTNSNLGGLFNRQIDWTGALENLIDELSGAMEQVAHARPVRYQTAGFHASDIFAHSGNRMARLEIENARAMFGGERFCRHHQHQGLPLRQLSEHRSQLIEIARTGVEKYDPGLLGCSPSLAARRAIPGLEESRSTAT
jgi:hypothetical protein